MTTKNAAIQLLKSTIISDWIPVIASYSLRKRDVAIMTQKTKKIKVVVSQWLSQMIYSKPRYNRCLEFYFTIYSENRSSDILTLSLPKQTNVWRMFHDGNHFLVYIGALLCSMIQKHDYISEISFPQKDVVHLIWRE